MPVRLFLLPFVVSLVACGPGTQSFPLDAAPAGQAALGVLQKCAERQGLQATMSQQRVRIEMTPERRVDFVLQPDKSFTMMTWVATDGDRGHLVKLKSLGEAIWECAGKVTASAASAASAPSASASVPLAPPPVVPTPPATTPAPPPAAPPSSVPSVNPGPAPPGASATVKSCEQDDSCARPAGAFCEANADCGSGSCTDGICK